MKQLHLVDPAKITIPSVLGVAKLAKVAFDGGDLGKYWQQLTSAFGKPEIVSEMCGALMDMCLIDQLTHNAERGLSLQAKALEICRIYQIPARTSSPRLRLLGFATADIINANIPIEFLIEDSDITLYLLYLVPGQPLPRIPEHDVAIVLVAESDKALPLLAELEALVADWPRPVLNLPGLVPQMGRERLHKVLAPITGIEIPATLRLERSILTGLCHDVASISPDISFPLIARPVDSHAGQGLEKIDSPFELATYLEQHAGEFFYVSRFVDYRGADGRYRKYRIMVIDGIAYPSHMAVSDHWMVHYLNAGMLESAEKREEEERFLNRFHQEFGLRHSAAITEMANRIRLDYFGIDCSETLDGKLLVFEASTALVVHNMDDPAVFPYKGPHMCAFFKAFQELLCRKSAACQCRMHG